MIFIPTIILFVLAFLIWKFKAIHLIAGLTDLSKKDEEKINKDKICNYVSGWLVFLGIIMSIFIVIPNSGLIMFIKISIMVTSIGWLLINLNSKKMLR